MYIETKNDLQYIVMGWHIKLKLSIYYWLLSKFYVNSYEVFWGISNHKSDNTITWLILVSQQYICIHIKSVLSVHLPVHLFCCPHNHVAFVIQYYITNFMFC